MVVPEKVVVRLQGEKGFFYMPEERAGGLPIQADFGELAAEYPQIPGVQKVPAAVESDE